MYCVQFTCVRVMTPDAYISCDHGAILDEVFLTSGFYASLRSAKSARLASLECWFSPIGF